MNLLRRMMLWAGGPISRSGAGLRMGRRHGLHISQTPGSRGLPVLLKHNGWGKASWSKGGEFFIVLRISDSTASPCKHVFPGGQEEGRHSSENETLALSDYNATEGSVMMTSGLGPMNGRRGGSWKQF